MPVRSLNSSVLVWPDRQQVHQSVHEWARALVAARPDLGVKRIGYFGSYARGDWGVGSDVDLVVIVDRAEEPFERRAVALPAESLPVPAEVLVYTETEWRNILDRGGRFADVLTREVVWMWPAGDPNRTTAGVSPEPQEHVAIL
jgi:hypothetical protein